MKLMYICQKKVPESLVHLATVEQGRNIFGDKVQGIDMMLETINYKNRKKQKIPRQGERKKYLTDIGANK